MRPPRDRHRHRGHHAARAVLRALNQLITTLKCSRTASDQEILVPGELENRAVEAAAGTVMLPTKTIDGLNALAAACGVSGLDAIRTNAAASLRDEQGCLAFDVHQDIEIPTRFYLYEIYGDEDAFRIAHRSAPHYAHWQEAAKVCVVDGRHTNTFARPVMLGQHNDGAPTHLAR